jgi:hypothetical protein
MVGTLPRYQVAEKDFMEEIKGHGSKILDIVCILSELACTTVNVSEVMRR